MYCSSFVARIFIMCLLLVAFYSVRSEITLLPNRCFFLLPNADYYSCSPLFSLENKSKTRMHIQNSHYGSEINSRMV
jgi:hypothetical protein